MIENNSCAKTIMDFVHKTMGIGLTILFLPYKADMWDSLESVYEEAKKEDYVYVYPLPYRAGNTEVGPWKKDPFPVGDDLIDCIDFKADVIFIHYPYDNNNYITKIAPTFFSENLSGKDRKLIYIPYFVADLNPALICQNAVLNADYVVVEDEEQVSTYYETLKQFGLNVSKKKFLPFGSPKYDSLSKQKHPEWKEWKNASGKEIVLYNTSVVGMLNSSADRIATLRENFERLSQDSRFMVWWRPHPLIKAMIEAQRPDLKESWDNLVIDFVQNKWGLYDDSRDFQRAIEVSDWCISDGSSVVKLCRKMGKLLVMEGDLWKTKF